MIYTLLTISSTSSGCELTTSPICVAADRLTAGESPVLNRDRSRSSLFEEKKYMKNILFSDINCNVNSCVPRSHF